MDAIFYTVSVQDTASKRVFCDRESLTHTLLSDVGAKIARAYGVLMPSRPMARRVTFYINPEGKIIAVDGSVKVQSAAEDALALLAKLGAGQPTR
jgi:thioredoxin-dependent peroxiredoxin